MPDTNPTPPELVHVATMTAPLGPESFFIPGGPLGTRVVAEVADVTVVGERFNAKMVGKSAADWLTVSPDRTLGTLDVRFTLRTDDDVLVYCSYTGRIDLESGRAVSTPLFECGDEKYAWLNQSQFIGDGQRSADGDAIVYELYEVRPV